MDWIPDKGRKVVEFMRVTGEGHKTAKQQLKGK